MLPLSAAVLALAGLTPQADDDAAAPVVRADPAVAEAAERTLGRPVTLHTSTQRALDAARGDWDLAQFELASTGRLRAMRKAGSAASAFLYGPSGAQHAGRQGCWQRRAWWA